jgi:hypothetical protein
MDEFKEPKFKTSECIVQELIYVYKADKGDYESLILFIESRLNDKSINVRNMLGSDLGSLIEECGQAMKESQQVSSALQSIAARSR